MIFFICMTKGIVLGVVGGLTAKSFGYTPTELSWWLTFSPFVIISLIVDVYLGLYDSWFHKPQKIKKNKKPTSENVEIKED